jgi:hypothetical protein
MGLQCKRAPDIVVDDEGVAAASGQRGAGPGHGGDASGVALERADLLHARRVPDLHLRARGAHRHVLAIRRPRHARHIIILVRALHQLRTTPALPVQDPAPCWLLTTCLQV